MNQFVHAILDIEKTNIFSPSRMPFSMDVTHGNRIIETLFNIIGDTFVKPK